MMQTQSFKKKSKISTDDYFSEIDVLQYHLKINF